MLRGPLRLVRLLHGQFRAVQHLQLLDLGIALGGVPGFRDRQQLPRRAVRGGVVPGRRLDPGAQVQEFRQQFGPDVRPVLQAAQPFQRPPGVARLGFQVRGGGVQQLRRLGERQAGRPVRAGRFTQPGEGVPDEPPRVVQAALAAHTDSD